VADTYGRVVSVLEESLAVDPAGVTPGCNLLTDLGADSLDTLDILFRLEGEFGLVVEREDLFPEFLFRADGDFVADGRLTEAGRRKVLEHYPFLDEDEVAGMGDPKSLFTVGLLAGFIDSRLGQVRTQFA
jgi:acyl carrier protein